MRLAHTFARTLTFRATFARSLPLVMLGIACSTGEPTTIGKEDVGKTASPIINGTNDTLSLNIDGNPFTLTLAHGTFDATQLAAAVQTAATSAGAPLAATVDASGKLQLASTHEGSTATMQVTGGSALTDTVLPSTPLTLWLISPSLSRSRKVAVTPAMASALLMSGQPAGGRDNPPGSRRGGCGPARASAPALHALQ